MQDKDKITIFKPFGPSIVKVIIPEEIIKTLNNYIDETIKDKKKSEKLDVGSKLAGNVKQEFRLEPDFIKSSNLESFLANGCSVWINAVTKKKLTKFQILQTWIVRQFQNDYNPIHVHGGHVSGVGYLKVPEDFGNYSQDNKTINENGTLTLIHGSKMFLSESKIKIIPKVGEFYFFPNYLMHAVYPFNNTDEERRSISFNAIIDDTIYDVYSSG